MGVSNRQELLVKLFYGHQNHGGLI
jgi:hypothetical protein